jgi:hypothetical protein
MNQLAPSHHRLVPLTEHSVKRFPAHNVNTRRFLLNL